MNAPAGRKDADVSKGRKMGVNRLGGVAVRGNAVRGGGDCTAGRVSRECMDLLEGD